MIGSGLPFVMSFPILIPPSAFFLLYALNEQYKPYSCGHL